ncbi:MAG: hypothetical protein IPP85_02545 [Propionivibrio sp.]|nr:hypothetical protein [Uliginosibacterium sp.]MBL0166072.1 hypothetical protein [Propionivibrio sp.]
MSYTSLFGAFPIAAQGGSLSPKPNELVGELSGSSRNGVFCCVVRELLSALPEYEALCFLAHEKSSFQQRSTDAQTLWTILDERSLPLVIANLDGLLVACHERAAAVADAVCFGSDCLTAEQVRIAVASAKECSKLNDEVALGEEGESADFVFAGLVSLRGLLRRALAHSERIAVFTWLPG